MIKEKIGYIIIGILIVLFAGLCFDFIKLNKTVSQDDVTLSQVVSFINASVKAQQAASATTATQPSK